MKTQAITASLVSKYSRARSLGRCLLSGCVLHWATVSPGAQAEISVRLVPHIQVVAGPWQIALEQAASLSGQAQWAAVTNHPWTLGGQMSFFDTNLPASGQRYYRLSNNLTNMVWVPPGQFRMGSAAADSGHREDESPVTLVTISQGFWMGRQEVTQGEYRTVTGENASWFSGNDALPAEMVSWSEATNYCGKLTARERAAGRISGEQEYRLPTEAEWEYACREGTTNQLVGDPEGLGMNGWGWYDDNSEGTTHPPGQKAANAWGLCDLHGNVWEWCSDWYGAYPGGSVADLQGPAAGAERVRRGGGWNSMLDECRTTRRSHAANARLFNTGLRVVLASANQATRAGAISLGIELVPQLTVKGQAGTYLIERAEIINDMPGWAGMQILALGSNSPQTVYDTNIWRGGTRFYRLQTNSGPPGMVWIPPGIFTMGSPAAEPDREVTEGPQTVVTVTQGFWMSQQETTQAEYQAMMGSNPSYFTGDLQRPVEQVTWNEATNYCGKVTARERAAGRLPAGYVYRLPTEAEWEYACRAGTTTRFSHGDDFSYTSLGKYAWYNGNSGNQTHPVGQKLPNAWGLYDMQGNVWEWCQDWFGTYPGGSVADPRGASLGSDCVRRGGSWFNNGVMCRSAGRGGSLPDVRYSNLGFRTALAPGQ